ncbi:MAG: hypothetical protein ABJN40_16485 [Sneathiella sp.]
MAKAEPVSIQRSVASRALYFDASSGEFTDKKRTPLRKLLMDLKGTDVQSVRLSPYTTTARDHLNSHLVHYQKKIRFPFPVTLSAIDPTPQLAAVRMDVIRLVAFYADCAKGPDFTRPGCAVAVNRALSLSSLEELRHARPLAPPTGFYEAKPLRDLRAGKTASFIKAEE